MPPLLIVGALDPDSYPLPGVTVSYQGKEDPSDKRVSLRTEVAWHTLGQVTNRMPQ